MIDRPLRALARAHAQGKLDYITYRAHRRKLLNSLVGEEQAPSGETSSLPAQESRKSWRGIAIIVGVVFLVEIGVFYTFFSQPPEEKDSVPTRSRPVPAVDSTLSFGRVLIANFLEKSEWSAGALEAFLTQWKTLPSEEQGKASQNWTGFQFLADQVRQRIQEKHASAAKQEEAVLRKFAETLGIATEITQIALAVQRQPPAIEAPAVAKIPTSEEWAIQIAIVDNERRAKFLQNALVSKGYSAYVEEVPETSQRWRVWIGPFGSSSVATTLRNQIKQGEVVQTH
ncbi:hypothetical protein CCP3SC1AL1_140017 [Gammaproteobacteria bacterium]